MTYVSKARRERALWMNFKDALAHVCQADGCERGEAQRQLLAAMDDRAVKFSFGDEERSRRGNVGPMTWTAFDALPDVGPTWSGAKIDAEGQVWADYGLTDEGRKQGLACYRAVFVHRLQLEQLWPILSPAVARQQAKAKTEGDITRWLESLMRESPNEPTAQAKLLADATSKWPGQQINRAFERAFAAAASNTGANAWTAAGRRKSPHR